MSNVSMEEIIYNLNEDCNFKIYIDDFLKLDNPLEYENNFISNNAVLIKRKIDKIKFDYVSNLSISYINVINKYLNNNKTYLDIRLYDLIRKIILILYKILDNSIEKYDHIKFINLSEIEFDNYKSSLDILILFKSNENPMKILNILIHQLYLYSEAIDNSIDVCNAIPLTTKSGWYDRDLFDYKTLTRTLSWISNCKSFKDNELHSFDEFEIIHRINYLLNNCNNE